MSNKRSKILQIAFAIFTVTTLYIGTKELVINRILADDSSTSVDVGSTAPSFTVAPAEVPVSDGAGPTNAGDVLGFEATASDANADDYYLAICKTNSITPGSSSAPTCGGGNWCISSATTSGIQASCDYTTVVGDAESNDWYAFVCDGSACSTSNQGSGSLGSPFKVNHRPTITEYQTCIDALCSVSSTTFNPGASVHFEGTDGDDPDTDTSPDTVRMFVCTTDSATSAGCAATTLCSSSLVSATPTCSYSIPSVYEDQTINYYIFLFDNHGFETNYNGGSLDNAGSFTVNNVAPTVTSVTLNSGSDITLTESANTNVVMTATVTDQNSCQDFSISDIKANLYRSGVTFASCDTAGESNNNSCYADVTCTISGNTCVDASDSSVSVTCTASVRHYADPTTTNTVYPSENWVATIDLTDAGANAASANATAVELNSLIALNATNTISYGSLSAGANTGATNQSVVVSATGNVGLDTELSGTDMEFSTYTIPVGNQEYSTSTFTYGAGTDLSSSPVEVELNVPKTTTETPASQTLYWGIGLPAIVGAGTYTGTNTLTAILGETAGW